MNTHNMIVDFGKHKGERWTRVPADYLRWLANSDDQSSPNVAIAHEELKRRGTKVSHEVEITPHAIDRASLKFRKIWHQTALSDNEGLYSWLSRVAQEASVYSTEDVVEYIGMRFCFKRGSIYPVLKTVK